MSDDNKKEDIEIIPDEEGDLPDLQKKIKAFRGDLRRCETERKEYLDGWQRARADLLNYKKEEGKRLEDVGRLVSGGMIEEIIPILDSFDLALSHGLPPEAEKGILLIRAQFEDVLKKRGLEEIEVNPGDEFNPEKHEALGEIESNATEGTIAELVQRGYLFRGRVLRPTRIRISKGR